jgi:hypothetical protein
MKKKDSSAVKPILEKKSSNTEILFDLPDDSMFKFDKNKPITDRARTNSSNSSASRPKSPAPQKKPLSRKASAEEIIAREDWVTF